MKFKILILFVSVLLVGTAISKDVKDAEVTAQLKVKKVFPADQIASDQSVRRNFLVTCLGAYSVVFNIVDFVVSKSDSYYLEHTLEYYSDANKDVEIYLLITGPEFATYFSPRYSAKANTSYIFSLNFQDIWKAGVYQATHIIRVIGGKGGTTLVEGNSYIVY